MPGRGDPGIKRVQPGIPQPVRGYVTTPAVLQGNTHTIYKYIYPGEKVTILTMQ